MFLAFLQKKFVYAKQLLILFLLIHSAEGVAMSFFTKPEEEIVLCSPMEGQITLHGKPVVGAKLQRWIKWKDEKGEFDTVFTNDHGRFVLPLKKENVKLSKFAQFVVAQEIRVFVKGVEYPIWVKAKRGKALHDELGGKPVNFRCELTDEVIPVDLGVDVGPGSGLLGTSCKWDSIERIGN